MPPSNARTQTISLRSFVLVIGVCFVVEVLVILVLGDLNQKYPYLVAIIDAAILSITLSACLVYWVLPDLVRSHRKTQDQAQLMNTLINAIPAPIFYKDKNGVYAGCNHQFESYLGRPTEKIVGQSVYDIAPPELADVYHQADMDLLHQGGLQVYETKVSHADGSEHDVMFHKAVYEKSDGSVGGIVGVMLDITERKAMEHKLQALASLDALTGISNRRELDNRLERALSRTERNQAMLALLFIDMDGFKSVNDILGHEAGDQVLKLVAQRIIKVLRKSDAAGRMGGDEFAVVLEGNISPETTILVAKKILVSLCAPYTLADGEVADISASIGIACSPSDGTDLKTLFAQADRAMYEAKKRGKNRYVMADEMVLRN